jgi:uncharacterized membrane protein YbaN (DUF454 family)
VSLKRGAFLAGGFLFFGMGVAGYLLPVMPGTVFMILSLYCFTRSSPAMETWLLEHKLFGPPLQRWRDTGAIPTRIKILAVSMIAISIAGSILISRSTVLAAIGVPLGLFGAWYIVSRPSGPAKAIRDSSARS